MMYEGKEVFTQETFEYDKAKVGDLVEAAVVMDAMECLPPACMRLSCAQLGEPYEPNGKGGEQCSEQGLGDIGATSLSSV